MGVPKSGGFHWSTIRGEGHFARPVDFDGWQIPMEWVAMDCSGLIFRRCRHENTIGRGY